MYLNFKESSDSKAFQTERHPRITDLTYHQFPLELKVLKYVD